MQVTCSSMCLTTCLGTCPRTGSLILKVSLVWFGCFFWGRGFGLALIINITHFFSIFSKIQDLELKEKLVWHCFSDQDTSQFPTKMTVFSLCPTVFTCFHFFLNNEPTGHSEFVPVSGALSPAPGAKEISFLRKVGLYLYYDVKYRLCSRKRAQDLFHRLSWLKS